MNTRKVTQEYRLNQWIGIIGECRASGQTVSCWCAEHDIDHKKYYYWLKKIRTAACESLPAINSGGNIVPLDIQETSLSVPKNASHILAENSSADIVIRLGSAVLEIHNNASASEPTLQEVLNYRRKKFNGQRAELLKDLPRDTILCALPADERFC